MQNLSLVVMAAGVGSRYGGLKQIEAVGPAGETILDYAVHDAVSAGFDRVVLVIRRDIEREFREVLGRRVEQKVETRYAFQELDDLPAGFAAPPGRTKPWGTGHAVRAARHAVSGPFAVVNADDFYGPGSYRALSAHLARRAAAPGPQPPEHCMAGFVLGKTVSEHGHVSRGLCTVSDEGWLTGIRELVRVEVREGRIEHTEDGGGSYRELDPSAVVSMNMWGFEPSFFEAIEARLGPFLRERGAEPGAELYLPSIVMDLLDAGEARVRVLRTDERWVGVTHRDDLAGVRARIRRLVDEGVYPEPLWAGR